MTAAPLDLDALKAKIAAATPAPWQFSPWHIEEGPSAVRAPEGWIIASTSSDANAELIAILRNAAPALFAAARERDKLREALEAAEAAMLPYVGWAKEGLAFADSVQPDLISFDDDCEADIADDIIERNDWPLLWGDFRRLRVALAKARAALGKPSVTSSTSDQSPK